MLEEMPEPAVDLMMGSGVEWDIPVDVMEELGQPLDEVA